MTTKYKNTEKELVDSFFEKFPHLYGSLYIDFLTSALHRIAEESIAAVVLDEKSVGSTADLTGIEKTREIYRVAGLKCPQLGGENHHLWRGGVTPEHDKIRHSAQYYEWREAVYKRDNYTCQECGARGVRLQADHIKPFAYFSELRFDINNGRTLCVPCHEQTETFGHKAKKYATSH